MTKYRIINKENKFYPQQLKYSLWWGATTTPVSYYATMEAALEDIEEHKKIFSKEFNKTTVVWEDK